MQNLLSAANNEESPQTSSASGGDSAAWKIILFSPAVVGRLTNNHIKSAATLPLLDLCASGATCPPLAELVRLWRIA